MPMGKKTGQHRLKPSTYASLVTIVFLLHKESQSKSIAGVIRSTDQLCDVLGYRNTISRMTKYRIISELIQAEILVSFSTAKYKKLQLSSKIVSFFP